MFDTYAVDRCDLLFTQMESVYAVLKVQVYSCVDCVDGTYVTQEEVIQLQEILWIKPVHSVKMLSWCHLNRHQTILGVYVNKFGKTSVVWRYIYYNQSDQVVLL